MMREDESRSAGERLHGIGVKPNGRVRLSLENVTKIFWGTESGDTTACLDLNMQIRQGEIVALVGPSGCGKSTTLGLLAGLFPPTKGRVIVDGDVVTGPRGQLTYMLQKDLLLPWRTVLRNVEFGLEIRGVAPKDRRDRALSILEGYGLKAFASHYPRQLSGGMRQRVALSRVVALDPEILLLDEPFSALDFQTKLLLQQELFDAIRRHNRTTLLVTHDLHEAVLFGDRVLIMSKRPGSIKTELAIDLPRSQPLVQTRSDPRMNHYFDLIWKELDHAI